MDTPQPPRGRRFDGPIKPTNPRRPVDAQPPVEMVVTPVEEAPVVATVPPIDGGLPPRRVPGGRKPRRWKRIILIGIALLIAATVAWFGVHAWIAIHNIIQKHSGKSALNGELDLSSLKGEGEGRVNILVMGIGGAGHDGPNLSDTMMVWSLDPKTYDVAAISVPRDLYVKIPGYGYDKINAANADGGPQLAENVVSTVLGININYYVVVDFSGFKQAIDSVGGVDVTVPAALFDKTYPCDVGNGICPYYQAAGNIHMSGAQALKYTRCRHNDAGVGNCGNDYGRSKRQQQVVAALRQKALSAGTLTNPSKITSLINTVGGHVKTDLQLGDLKTLALLATKIDPTKVVNKVLDDEPGNYLVGGTDIIPAAGYIYAPKLGNFNYQDIHDFVKNIFVDRYIVSENARLQVDNGSGITGIAGRVVTSLQAAHYNVGAPANAATLYPKTVLYDYTGGKKPYTIKYLEQRFGVTAVKATPSPTPSPVATSSASASSAPASPEIRIILGSNYQASSQAQTSN